MKGVLESTLAIVYVEGFKSSNKATAEAYGVRLRLFERYLKEDQKTDIDTAISKMQARALDPYSVVAGFAAFMGNRNISARYQVQTVKTVKNFLETNDIELSRHKFKLKVKLKRIIKKKKQGLSKEEVREIIRGCEGNIRLLTYVMFLGCTE